MVMRISGLSSGFDTENTVAKLMEAKRVPLDKLGQKKQTYEWQREALRETNTKVTEFRNTKLFNFKLESTFNAKIVNISGGTDMTAKGTAGSIDSSVSVVVHKLAKAASQVSNGDVTLTGFDATAALSGQSSKLAFGDVTGTHKFSINGKDISVDTNKEYMNDIIAKINSQTNVTAFYDSASNKVSLKSNSSGKVNGTDGKSAEISVSGDLMTKIFKMDNTVATTVSSGNDADVTINGLRTTRNTNNFVVNGIELNLLKEGGSEHTVTTVSDVDKIMSSIKTFISDYNDILKYVGDKSTEERYRDYAPLTDKQKEALSEKQIENWEAKSKSGILKNDPILNDIVRALRSSISAVVDTGSAKYNSLASIGIETGQYFENGKLYLNNEDKLREAIKTNPEAVKAIFTGDATESKPAKAGVAERMYSELKKGTDSITVKAGLSNVAYDDSLISRLIQSVNSEMTLTEKRLSNIEDGYYRQFTAMETSLNKLNSQGQQLLSQLGGK